MAIQASKTLPNGSSGNYWKITKFSLDKPSLLLSVTLSLFLDQATSQSGAPGLGENKYYFFPLTKEQAITNLIALAYTNILSISASMVFDRHSLSQHVYDPDLANGIEV